MLFFIILFFTPCISHVFVLCIRCTYIWFWWFGGCGGLWQLDENAATSRTECKSNSFHMPALRLPLPLSPSLSLSLSLFRFGNLFFSRFPVLPLRLQSKKIPLAQQKPSLLFPLGFLLCLRSLMRFKCFRKCKYSIHATKHTINICKTKNNQLTNTKYPWKIPNDINLSSIYFGQIYFSHYFN